MQPSDVQQLEGQLLDRRKAAWISALREEAAKYNCNRMPNPPSGSDLDELEAMSQEDAQGIADTWNRDVENQVEQINQADKYGSRYYYIDRMEAWANQRDSWKSAQIAIQTEQTTRFYTQDRFRQMNGERGGKYKFVGPPPVCEKCIYFYSLGLVTEAFIQRHPAPVHIGCPHEWEAATIADIPCNELWLG